MNSSAKIKEEDSVKLVEALEGKYSRVLQKSQSKDPVTKMLDLMKYNQSSIRPHIKIKSLQLKKDI